MAVNYRNKDGNIEGLDQNLLDNRTFDWNNLQSVLFDTNICETFTKATMGGVNADQIVRPLAVFQNKLYFSTYNTTAATDSTAAKIITYDGAAWATVTKATMGGVNADQDFDCAQIYNGKLYISTYNTTAATDSTAAKILEFDGSSWIVYDKATMGAASADTYFRSMCVFGSNLYIGTNNATAATDATGAKLIKYTGAAWSIYDKATMGGVNADVGIAPLAVYRNILYVGTYNTTAATDSTAAKIITYDGAAWATVTKATMGGVNADTGIKCATVNDGKLWIGTYNSTAAVDNTAAKLIIYENGTWTIITKTTIFMTSLVTGLFPTQYNGRLYILGDSLLQLSSSSHNIWYNQIGDIWKTTWDVATYSPVVFQGYLYIGTYNTQNVTDATGAKIMRIRIPIMECLNSYTSKGF